jgi:uncharacterized membrane protein YbhN (UPF0104 family)
VSGDRPPDRGDRATRTALPPKFDVRHLVRRTVWIGLILLVVLVAVSTLPGLGEVRERFATAQPAWLLGALGLKLGSVLAYVAAFRGVFCPRLDWRLSFEIATSEQAANVLLPTGGAGGLALGAWALQRGGMPTGHIARRTVAFFLITSSVNFAAVILAGVALALGIAGSAPPGLALAPAALAALAVLAVVLLPRVLPEGAGRPRGWLRGAVTAAVAALADGIHDARALVLAGDPLVIGGAVGYMGLDVGALGAAFHAFGVAPSAGVLVLSYTVGQLGGLIPIPGGIGGVDGGLIGALVVYGISAPEATAAVLAYRTVQLGVPAIVGTVAFVRLQRTLARSSNPTALCAPMAAGALR